MDLYHFLASFATQTSGDTIVIPTKALDRCEEALIIGSEVLHGVYAAVTAAVKVPGAAKAQSEQMHQLTSVNADLRNAAVTASIHAISGYASNLPPRDDAMYTHDKVNTQRCCVIMLHRKRCLPRKGTSAPSYCIVAILRHACQTATCHCCENIPVL
jgi:hypothetical protein